MDDFYPIKKRKAIYLLIESTKTKKEIAEYLNITEQTLYNWLKDEEFIDELKTASFIALTELHNSNIFPIVHISNKALDVFSKLLESKDESILLKSSMFILNILNDNHNIFKVSDYEASMVERFKNYQDQRLGESLKEIVALIKQKKDDDIIENKATK